MDCIFCKIIQGEIPSYKVYEDEDFFGLLDIFPRSEGHSLLIPKKHYRWVYDVPQFGEYWEAARNLSRAVSAVTNPQYISFFTFGMQVPHAHIHIMPMYSTEEGYPQRGELDKEKAAILAPKILSKTQS